MELSQLMSMLRKWFWLLGVGLAAGALLGFGASLLQKPVYEASAKLFVSKSSQSDYSSFAGLTNQQLVQTYVQILKTNRLREEIAKQLEMVITSDQVDVRQVSETQIIEVTAVYPDAEKAASIANAIVQKIIKDDAAAENTYFSNLETSLAKQIDELEKNAAAAQTEFNKLSESEYQNQLSMVEEELLLIQSELSTLQIRIAELTPALNNADKAELAEKQQRVAQLNSNADIYENIRANLVTQGQPLQTNRTVISPRLLLLQTTVDSYQKKSLELRVELETARQEHEYVVPNAEIIEDATIPLNPARPSRLMYTALGGIVGFMLIGAIMIVVEALRGSPSPVEVKPRQEEARPPAAPALPVNIASVSEKAPPDIAPSIKELPAKVTHPEITATVENPPPAEPDEIATSLKHLRKRIAEGRRK
jgi:uncharacterized protein involved in exopolysaccharide biosynthesis